MWSVVLWTENLCLCGAAYVGSWIAASTTHICVPLIPASAIRARYSCKEPAWTFRALQSHTRPPYIHKHRLFSMRNSVLFLFNTHVCPYRGQDRRLGCQDNRQWKWQGCQPYVPAAFNLQKTFMVIISVRGLVDPNAIVRP